MKFYRDIVTMVELQELKGEIPTKEVSNEMQIKEKEEVRVVEKSSSWEDFSEFCTNHS